MLALAPKRASYTLRMSDGETCTRFVSAAARSSACCSVRIGHCSRCFSLAGGKVTFGVELVISGHHELCSLSDESSVVWFILNCA